MTSPFIPPLGTLINTGKPYAHKVTPAWIAKRLRRHAGAPARVKARYEAFKKASGRRGELSVAILRKSGQLSQPNPHKPGAAHLTRGHIAL